MSREVDEAVLFFAAIAGIFFLASMELAIHQNRQDRIDALDDELFKFHSDMRKVCATAFTNHLDNITEVLSCDYQGSGICECDGMRQIDTEHSAWTGMLAIDLAEVKH